VHLDMTTSLGCPSGEGRDVGSRQRLLRTPRRVRTLAAGNSLLLDQGRKALVNVRADVESGGDPVAQVTRRAVTQRGVGHHRPDSGSDVVPRRGIMSALPTEGGGMAKKSRKRRARAKKKANHGKRPNA
jgi:hypothetical protein